MLKSKLLLTLLFLNFFCKAQKFIPQKASILSIIANPQYYDSSEVIVDGFLHYRFEDHMLFPVKENADYLMIGALWVKKDSNNLSVDLNLLDNKYVKLTGTFYKIRQNSDMPYQGILVVFDAAELVCRGKKRN